MASTGSDGYDTTPIEVWSGDQFLGHGEAWEADYFRQAGYRVVQPSRDQGDQNDLER